MDMQMLKVRTEKLRGDLRGFYKQTDEALKCWDEADLWIIGRTFNTTDSPWKMSVILQDDEGIVY